MRLLSVPETVLGVKHVVGFSGGAAYAVVAKIVAERHPGETILLFCDTLTEPPDNDRFRVEVANYIGLPIVRVADGRDIWQLFLDEGYLGNQRATPCSEHLKVIPGDRWMKENGPCIYYVGYTPDEWRRAQRLSARKAQAGIETRFPLMELGISKEECFERVRKCWGLILPEMYEWAEHANCIPCVKAGLAYWGMVYLFHPKEWAKAVRAEKESGYQILSKSKGYGTLEEELPRCLRLAREWMEKKKAGIDQGSLYEFPCECAL